MASDFLLHVIWGRTRTTGVEEDEAMCTMHFQGPDTSWPTTPPQNYEGAEAALVTWWNTLVPLYTTRTKLTQLRWYRRDDPTDLWGSPARVTNFNSSGSESTPQVPPQCAVVVTEWTDYQEQEEGRTVRHWGRFYLPAMAASAYTIDGTASSSTCVTVADATEDLYNTLIDTVDLGPMVLVTRFGDPPLPVHVPIKELRVDNVVDTQRRRKWDTVTQREVRELPDYWGQ